MNLNQEFIQFGIIVGLSCFIFGFFYGRNWEKNKPK